MSEGLNTACGSYGPDLSERADEAEPDVRLRPRPPAPVSVGWRVDTALVERIRAEADARGLTDVWFVSKLLAEGLDRLIPASEFRLTRPPTQSPPEATP